MLLTPKGFIEMNMFEEILDNCNDAVNAVDINGNIIFANEISAHYAKSTKEDMIGRKITDFYPRAVLLTVLESHEPLLDKRIHDVFGKRYVVDSYPIFRDGEFLGAYSVFNGLDEIDELNRKIKYLQMQIKLIKPEENISGVVDMGSIKNVFNQAKKIVGSLGGPRHSIITGESGTGKTMLATLIYNYAKRIGVIGKNAPFIEVNCAQFVNPDIAAMEIFGSVEGAFTGSKKKSGLFEQANGGILFLDEAHTIENYQNLLLKAIESGKVRRIGDTKEISSNVIIIAASTRNLDEVFLPELYQRLAQYEMHLPSLNERPKEEKEMLFSHFVKKYEQAVWESHKVVYHVKFTDEAKEALLSAVYPRNIRQFRDVINFSIDAAAPLIEDIGFQSEITTIVGMEHIPFNSLGGDTLKNVKNTKNKKETKNINVDEYIEELRKQGLGARKISGMLEKEGIDMPYYKVSYILKKKGLN